MVRQYDHQQCIEIQYCRDCLLLLLRPELGLVLLEKLLHGPSDLLDRVDRQCRQREHPTVCVDAGTPRYGARTGGDQSSGGVGESRQ
jgi:hypothetical protein